MEGGVPWTQEDNERLEKKAKRTTEILADAELGTVIFVNFRTGWATDSTTEEEREFTNEMYELFLELFNLDFEEVGLAA